MILVRHLLAYSPRVLALLAVICSVLAAQNRAYEGSNVVEIRFEPAKQPLQAGELGAAVGLKTGEPAANVPGARLHWEALRNGPLLGYPGRRAPGEWRRRRISFITKPRWFIGDVAITGNIPNPPTAGQLEERRGVEPRRRLFRSQPERGARGSATDSGEQRALSSQSHALARLRYRRRRSATELLVRCGGGPPREFRPTRADRRPEGRSKKDRGCDGTAAVDYWELEARHAEPGAAGP